MRIMICESFKTQKEFIDKLKELISNNPLRIDVRPVVNIKSEKCLKNFNKSTSIHLNCAECMLVYDSLGFSILVDVGSLTKCIFNNLNITKDINSDLKRIESDIKNIEKVLGNIPAVEKLKKDTEKLAETLNDKFDSNNYEYKNNNIVTKSAKNSNTKSNLCQ